MELWKEIIAASLGFSPVGSLRTSSLGDLGMEGHGALVVLSHSARWAEVEDSHTCRDVFPASLSLAGAPLPLFIPLQDVWPATWPFLPGRLASTGALISVKNGKHLNWVI